ncbi:MAG: B12-binding domain-containing radical SAM protein [Candidatus Bathyarchaeota archaeon]|nr:B12-binding domain-containing radical SAM protein [Candidatus Bathyarchaeota archaeon]
MATKIMLVYPYFHPNNDNSIFRFPPLGLGYIASALIKRGFDVEIVDCTFLGFREAVEHVKQAKPKVVGFYSMFSMKKTTVELAKAMRRAAPSDCVFVVGGPLPSWEPEGFLGVFDVVVVGEGEETVPELVDAISQGRHLSSVRGLVYREGECVINSGHRDFIADLDSLKFPSRELFDNQAYKNYYLNRFGYSTTSMITSRGCPFLCDFCSRPIFGNQMRTRSVDNIVDEVEEITALGYDRVWFADDCFTFNRWHLLDVCSELIKRHVKVGWECLSRVDTMDTEVAHAMKRAGCIRVFVGIESGNDAVLRIMNKHITTSQARQAVYAAKAAGLEVGAFFIVGYPGENDETVLDTVRFASALPLNYLSFTLPYPIPGTPLYAQVKDEGVSIDDWEEPKNYHLIRHKLLYSSGFSEIKLKFAIAKAQAQFYGRKILGRRGYSAFGKPFESLSDWVFKRLH